MMSIKFSVVILISLFLISMSFAQDQIIDSSNCEIKLSQNADSVIQKRTFKITCSDSWVGRDKVYHFLTSALSSGSGYYLLHHANHWSNLKSQQGAVCFSLSLGLVKEIRDGFKPNNAFSVKDFLADILGTAVGMALVAD